ncbi:MAG TPA: hypothetical protein VI322_01145 [Candidatus Saccharimonadia bacterium]
MAKKKNSNRKYKFKYSEPVQAGSVVGSTSKSATAVTATTADAVVAGHHYDYVKRDVRRLSVIAVMLVLTELVLWYLLGHTQLGQSVYGWFRV